MHLNKLFYSGLVVLIVSLANQSIYAQEGMETPVQETQETTEPANGEQNSSVGDMVDYVDDETWAILHGTLHAIINEFYGTEVSILVSEYWEYLEHN